jgi:proline racemase
VCECRNGKVERVSFVNQPAFCYHLDHRVEVEGLGSITVDVAYGGMTYVLMDAASLGFKLESSEARDLCTLGQRIKKSAAEQTTVSHPENPAIPGITQTLFAGPVHSDGDALRSRNAVVVSPGRVDRSPCGTGTCARLAVLHAKGQLAAGQTFIHESLIGTTFHSTVRSTTTVGTVGAVIPEVSGRAWITGIYQMGLDPTDPFPRGFTLSDTWLGHAGDPVHSASEDPAHR